MVNCGNYPSWFIWQGIILRNKGFVGDSRGEDFLYSGCIELTPARVDSFRTSSFGFLTFTQVESSRLALGKVPQLSEESD